MLPRASLKDAVSVAERIRRTLESRHWTLEPNGERVGRVTVSFGVAKLRPDETGAELLKRAGQRLYDAKAKGRNCVVAESGDELSRPDGRPRVRRAASG